MHFEDPAPRLMVWAAFDPNAKRPRAVAWYEPSRLQRSLGTMFHRLDVLACGEPTDRDAGICGCEEEECFESATSHASHASR